MGSLNRREAIRFIPALGAAIIVLTTGHTATRTISRHPDAELLRLGRQLERGVAHEVAMTAAADRDPDFDVWMERAYEANRATVAAIEAESASTLEGLRVKAAAISWCHQGEPEIIFDSGTTNERLAAQIVNALLIGSIA